MEQPQNVSNEKTPPARDQMSAHRAEATVLEGRVTALEKRLRAAGQTAFAVQAAENEGMPIRPDAGPVAPRDAGARRQTGASRPAPPKSGAQAHQPRPRSPPLRRIKPMKYDAHSHGRTLGRLVAKLTAVAGLITSLAFPVFAQDGTGPIPQNAQARSYGGGWNCVLGYRVDGAECLTIELPENAYATGRSYGTGWECRRGYEERGEASCAPILVPAHAFLQSYGSDWQCERGYRQDRETCVPIILPEHAFLTEDPGGTGWTCDRGFVADEDACVPVAVPENGYLTNAEYGDTWRCDRGFFEVDDRCDVVVLPANAFLDTDTYGPGWRCERGYESKDRNCVAIELPKNAHLDRSGNRWTCDRGFHLSDGGCALGR